MAITRKPEWLKKKIDPAAEAQMEALLRSLSLHTVCEGANCPNRSECFKSKTATFMILGDTCARAAAASAPSPKASRSRWTRRSRSTSRIAAEKLGLKHVVVTSVTRDDLAGRRRGALRALPFGSAESAPAGKHRRGFDPRLSGQRKRAAGGDRLRQPDIVNHNVETVPSLYRTVRPQAVYERSLELLRRVNRAGAAQQDGAHGGSRRDEGGSAFACWTTSWVSAAACSPSASICSPASNTCPLRNTSRRSSSTSTRPSPLPRASNTSRAGRLVRSSYHAAEGMKFMEENQ